MSVDAREHQRVGAAGADQLVEPGAEERAVALLDHLKIIRTRHKLRDDPAAVRALDGDADVVAPHLAECVGQIGLELLPHPDDRMPGGAEGVGQRADRRDQRRPIRRRPSVEEIDQHVDDEKHRLQAIGLR